MTTSDGAQLDLYDIAFLAGGPARVVDTALVALVGDGRLRVHSPGELAVAEPSRRHPVEAAVLDAVGTAGHRSVDTIRWRVKDDERLHALGGRLVDEGLLHRVPWPRASRAGNPKLTRTRKGNGALAVVATARAADTAHDPTGALLVAVSGIDAMPDRARRSAIFERPHTTLTAPRGRGRTDELDPQLAAYRAGGAAALGGGVLGLSSGFDGGGGGGGGGDG
jgi:hypothetical protein